MAAMKFIAAFATVILLSNLCSAQDGNRQCTGVRVGEVTATSAIIWARITATARRSLIEPIDATDPEAAAITPEFLAEKQACPGALGSIQIDYSTSPTFSNLTSTAKIAVKEISDYSTKFKLTSLLPDTTYYYKSKTYAPNGVAHTPLQGQFKTAPLPTAAADITFTVLTCQRYENLDNPLGFKIFPVMAKLNPDFTVSLGDLVYYDNEDPSVSTRAEALFHWQQMYSLPYHTNYLLKYAGYFAPDDHDTLENDCGPTSSPVGSFSFKQGQSTFKTEMPVGNLLYRTFSWGKDAQIWILDSRSYRSNNEATDGPKKTLLGATQKAWLKSTVLKSNATWKIILAPAPFVGPDEPGKNDNLSNAPWKYEGNEMRKFLGAQKNLFVVTGDRHWQYHSVDPATGLNEFDGGPTSDSHAQEDVPIGKIPAYHKFYKVSGGFTTVKIKSGGTGTAGSTATVSLHDTKGAVAYSYTFKHQA
jgi:alkaline phosphatase D